MEKSCSITTAVSLTKLNVSNWLYVHLASDTGIFFPLCGLSVLRSIGLFYFLFVDLFLLYAVLSFVLFRNSFFFFLLFFVPFDVSELRCMSILLCLSLSRTVAWHCIVYSPDFLTAIVRINSGISVVIFITIELQSLS